MKSVRSRLLTCFSFNTSKLMSKDKPQSKNRVQKHVTIKVFRTLGSNVWQRKKKNPLNHGELAKIEIEFF